VMLSAETAIGRYPVAAVRMLRRVVAATEAEFAVRMSLERLRSAASAPADAVSFAACQLAVRLDARAIVAPLHDVAAVLAIARLRPSAPFVVVAGAGRLLRQLALVRGVAPLDCAEADPDARLARAREWVFASGLAQRADPAVLVFNSHAGQGTADSLRAVRLE
jgi:pyruvate kinase